MPEQTPAASVLWLLDFCDDIFWLDGGWGVDALIGRQSRVHEDVDVVLEEQHAGALALRLRQVGFQGIPRDDTRPCNFVLGRQDIGLIDFHVVRFDAAGNGVYGMPEPEGCYPAQAFTGRGRVLERSVRCLSLAYQIESHNAGYPLRDKDFADMAALASATGASLPARLKDKTGTNV